MGDVVRWHHRVLGRALEAVEHGVRLALEVRRRVHGAGNLEHQPQSRQRVDGGDEATAGVKLGGDCDAQDDQLHDLHEHCPGEETEPGACVGSGAMLGEHGSVSAFRGPPSDSATPSRALLRSIAICMKSSELCDSTTARRIRGRITLRSYLDRIERSKMLRRDVSRTTRPIMASTASVRPKLRLARLGLEVMGRLPETVGSTVRNRKRSSTPVMSTRAVEMRWPNRPISDCRMKPTGSVIT